MNDNDRIIQTAFAELRAKVEALAAMPDSDPALGHVLGRLFAHRALIDACRCGLLLPAADIPNEQCEEIAREIQGMHALLGMVEKGLGLPPVALSPTFTRNALN